MRKTWLVGPLASATAALVLGLLAPTPAIAANAAEAPPVTLFSQNVAFSLSTTKAMNDVKRVLPMGQIGGFQEFSQDPDRKALAALLSSRGWAYYMPSGRAGSDPIAWDMRRFTLVPGSGRSIMAYDTVKRDRVVPTSTPVAQVLDPVTGLPVLDPVTGLPTCADGRPWNAATNSCDPILGTKTVTDVVSPARYINSVRLTDNISGRVIGFINSHAIAMGSFDAQYGGKDDTYDKDPNKLDTYNTTYLLEHFRVIAAEIAQMKTHTSSFAVTGDFNVNFIADQRRRLPGFPTAMFGATMNFDMPVAQAGGSLLDYVMTLKGGGLTLTSSKLVKGLNSDHPAVVATYGGGSRAMFAPGILRNAPRARATAARRMVLDRILVGISGASPGTTVKIQTRRFSNGEIKSALRAARARGVQVSVKVKRRNRTTLVLIGSTAGYANVSLRTGTPLVRNMPRIATALTVSSDSASYAASNRLFQARR
ncbi:MAG: hypothetical protein U0R21_08385 [Nocardioidaceae bacterium]